MIYCSNCGAENIEKYRFCVNCGESLYGEEKPKKSEIITSYASTSEAKETYVPKKTNLVRRNFLIWYLLSMVTGIFNYVYWYFNFQDLNELDRQTPNKEGPSLYVDQNKVLIYLVLSFLIPFFLIPVNYWKYDKLHKYLQYNNPENQKTMPISGKKRITLYIVNFVFTLLMSTAISLASAFGFYHPYGTIILGIMIPLAIISFIIILTISIYMIVCDYRWQEALNERILLIDPQAEEKMLF